MPDTPHDPYAGLADRYDPFFTEDGPSSQERAFYRQLFAEHGVKHVLDCACGTARDLLLLHDLGCSVMGSDLSPAMLAQARRTLRTREHGAPLIRADYRRLPFRCEPGAFDAVVCLSSSILEMPTEGELVSALRSMHRVLREGGVLVLTQGTTHRQLRERPRFVLERNDERATRLFVIDYLGERGVRYNIVDITRAPDGGGMEAWSRVRPRLVVGRLQTAAPRRGLVPGHRIWRIGRHPI